MHRAVLFVLLALCVLPARAATFNVSGTTLQLNLTAANETVAITAGPTNYTFALTGGTWSGTDSADATGNGTASLSAVKASFTAVTVDDSSTGNGANFNDSGANTYTSNFTVTLDSATPGTSTFSGTTAFTGSAALWVQSGGIGGNSGSVVRTVDGNLTLLGNMQTPGQTGNLFGISLNNTRVTVSGSGNLTMKGKCGISTSSIAGVKLFAGSVVTGGIAGTTLTVEGYGAASSGRNYGINLVDAATTITTAGGDVVITGVGGSGGSSDNKGVLMEINTAIRTIGSGSLTITGTGGGVNTASNSGFDMQTATQITTVDGSISVTGTGGGGATGTSNRGVVVSGWIRSTGSGNVSVTGTGGPGSGGDNQGVLMERYGATGGTQEIKSGTGNIRVTGTPGGGAGSIGIKVNSVSGAPPTISTGGSGSLAFVADSMVFVTDAAISAPSISVTQKTPGKNIELGSSSDTTTNTLGISQAELNTFTTSTLSVGDANTAVFKLASPIALPAGTTTNVTAAVINLNGNTVSGGPVAQTSTNQPVIVVEQPVGTVLTSGLTKALGGLAVGSTVDTVFTVKNVGLSDLTGLGITIDGTDASEFSVVTSPVAPLAPGGSTTFTIRHSPTSVGNKTAAIHLASNAVGIPSFDVNFTANSLPDINVEQPVGTVIADGGTKGFGGLAVGSTADLVFTVKNPGNSGLTISGITFDGTNASEFSVLVAPAATVSVGGSTTFTIRHTPVTVGNKTAALHIASNVLGTKNPYDINLTANSLPDISVEQPAGTAVPDGSTKSFAGVLLGSTLDLAFTVSNPGISGLNITGITIDGRNAGEFSVLVAPASSVPVSGTTTFTIRYVPTSIGSKTAALHIATNVIGAKSSYDINLLTTAFSATPVSGAKSIGPTGDYTSLADAIADIQGATLSGPVVLELQPAYVSTVETFPLVFTNLGTTATNTLIVRPQAGATGLSVTSADTTAATVDLNGAQYVTIDGRPGGTGTAKQLTIENTNTSGVALRFINEASNNTIKHSTLQGVNTNLSSGTVLFSGTTGANGNDNNTIDTCDIRDGASTPIYGISSFGSTTAVAKFNSGNAVTNCNIFNFYNPAGTSFGVQLSNGSTDWTISGNSFYQTASRAAAAYTVNPILINATTGNNFIVTGNFIGGSAPNCGGAPWTTTGTSAAYLFQGISLAVGNTTATSVQGNTIANFVWTSGASSTWTGISVTVGTVNIGTVTGNTIGSSTGTNSISITTSVSGVAGVGISNSGGTTVIANNTVGSITTNGTTTSLAVSLNGISVTAGANTISNNVVGSTTTANSLNAATSSISGSGQNVTGIVSSSSGSASITGNTVANLNNSYVGSTSTGQIRGIVTTAGVNTITSNTVRNLSTTSANANATTSQSVIGIAATSTAAGQTVSQNTVHSLANTAALGSVSVTGIYFAGPTSGTNVIARNSVHSLAVSSTSATSVLNGMQFVLATFTAQNNSVRVGLDASGNSTASASIVRGIYDNGNTAGRNFYHNSVYLGGTQTSGAASTFAFTGISGVTNARTYQNNLFVNARSNSGATSKHYAVQYGGGTANPTGLTANGNLFLASGTGGVLGLYNSTDRTTLTDWQTATGKDASSLNADPLYLNPTGDRSTVNLHLQAASPAFNTGLALAAVTDDIDGNTRNATTPTIGADEFFGSNIIVTETSILTDGVSSIDFGTVTVGSSSIAKTFTLTNLGNVDLTTLAITKDGTNASDFTISALSGTTVPVGSGSVTFTVTFMPSASGARSAAIHITSNVLGTKNPFDIALTGTAQSLFEAWAATNGVSTSGVGANGLPNLQNFAFGQSPASSAQNALSYAGNVITPGDPTTEVIANVPTAEFIRRKDHATAGIAYTVQFSADLTTWETDATPPVVLADDGTNQVVGLSYPLMTSGAQATFFKVTVSP